MTTVLILLLSGCSGGSDSTSPTVPLANAGDDQLVTLGTQFTLDSSSSTDPQGESLRYNWKMIAQPIDSFAPLSDPTAASPTYTPDRGGALG
ncbi:MAG: hypothetical protein V7629_02220 [Motiliproteus sp.]